ncbi:MAG: fibronectin type III domain-containing protein [Rhodopseudomonas palustris]|nr:fibronectin type III domain-containing protein [Rhodopseudomonas palustris]
MTNLWQLEQLDLSDNQFEGTIPGWIGYLSRLKTLGLANNRFTGAIPNEYSSLSNIERLMLGENQLTGPLPSWIGSFEHLDFLSIPGNQLTGPVPLEFSNLVSLHGAYLNGNQLSGGITTQFAGLPTLAELNLAGNQFTGSLPDSIGIMANIDRLDVSGNHFSGPIPDNWANLSSVRYLTVQSNDLSGAIPAWLGALTTLNELRLDDCAFSGSLPSQIGGLVNLASFSVRGNKLSGEIPSDITNLVNLVSGPTDFGYNGFVATDPGVIAFLSSKDPDWTDTQTITPANVSANPLSQSTVRVSWDPIPYTGNEGGYRVLFSTVSGGPYDVAGITADKTMPSLDIASLDPETTYFFVVETETRPHENNRNTLVSGVSTEVSATTTIIPGITVVSPNGSEFWHSGSTRSISWTSGGGVGNVTIEFSADDGASWTAVTASTENDGSYDWTIPVLNSANCRIRVSDAGNPAVNDASDNPFTITNLDDAYEDNDTMGAAAELTPGVTGSLALRFNESTGEMDQDWFKIQVSAGQDRIAVDGEAETNADYEDIDIEILDAAGKVIYCGMGDSAHEAAWFDSLPAGWVYLRLAFASDNMTYSVTIETGSLPIGHITGRVTNESAAGIAIAAVILHHNVNGNWNYTRGICVHRCRRLLQAQRSTG